MSAELPRRLHAATPVAVSGCEARQARAELEIITATIFRRHAEDTRTISSNGSGKELNLRLKTAGDFISFLVFSLQEFRDQGRKSLYIDVVREFKDADYFSREELETMAVWEAGKELGSRHVCEYYYDMESEPADISYVWRTDWDFHHGRGLALDRAREYTPDEFCALIMDDGGQQVEVGTQEICALGIILAAASPYPYENLPDAGGFAV